LLDLLKELLDPSNPSSSKSPGINSSLKMSSSNIENKVSQPKLNFERTNNNKESLK